MTYRVSTESPEDPLRVDEALSRHQYLKQRALVHGLVTVLTLGFWLPIFIGWYVWVGGWKKDLMAGYVVRIDNGQLTIGTSADSKSIPLDGIATISVSSGVLTIATKGVAQPIQAFGLVDPQAASRAILDARDAYMRGLAPAARVQALDDVITPEERRAARRS